MSLPPGASSRDRWLDLADEARDKAREALVNGDRRIAELWDEHERTLLRNAYEDVPHPEAGARAADTQPTGTVGDLSGPISSNNPFDALADDPDVSSPRSVADGEGVQVAAGDESAVMALIRQRLALLGAATAGAHQMAQGWDDKHKKLFSPPDEPLSSGSSTSPEDDIRQRGIESFPSGPPPSSGTLIPPQEMQTPGFPGEPFDLNGEPGTPLRPIVMKGAKFPTASDKGTVFIYPDLSSSINFPLFVESHRGDSRTQGHMDVERDKIIAENPECQHIAGGRNADNGTQIPEQYISNPKPPPGKDGRTGSVNPDMTFKCPDGSFVYVNTVDVYKNGDLKPREADAVQRLTTRIRKGDRIILIPKPWQME